VRDATVARLLCTVHEAAAMLSIGRTSLYALIDSGQLERVKIGRRTLVPAESITAYITRLRGCDPRTLGEVVGLGTGESTPAASVDTLGR
jgi:excisionase family DNA binding protein